MPKPDTYVCVKCNSTYGHGGRCAGCMGWLKPLEKLTDEDLRTMGIREDEPEVVTWWSQEGGE